MTQTLYRLVYDGGDGRVSLRVVMREGEGRFQLSAADIAGRTVWSVDSQPTGVVMVDHRAGRYCTGGAEFRLADVHPVELPLSALPAVLAGRLPLPPPAAGATEWTDAGGARWRASWEDDEPIAWSLYDGDQPVVWWSRSRDGFVLSRRGGEQYRWTTIASERVERQWPEPVPNGFELGVCDGQSDG